MEVHFTFAETSLFQCTKKLDQATDHPQQCHLSIPSLPCPTKPLSISSYPIELTAEPQTYSPKHVASLWLQLLSIHIQCGNFWAHKDVLNTHRKVVEARSRVDRDNGQPKPLSSKSILYLRYKLQKGFLTKDRTLDISHEELKQMDSFISKLYASPALPESTIKETKIHKVMKNILKLDSIPGDAEFGFRPRAETLLARYQEALDNAPAEPEYPTNKLPTEESEDMINELPDICLTQLTPSQCAQLKEVGLSCVPPLSPAVIELACIMPYFTKGDGQEPLLIAPYTNLTQPFQNFHNIDRSVYKNGPAIPPEIFQLTENFAPGYRTTVYLDTNTGESFESQIDQVKAGADEAGQLSATFDGPRRPVIDLLQEWIDNFLSLKWIFAGDSTIFTVESRSMAYLDQKDLLVEYGWPQSFPLPQPQYHEFLKRKASLWTQALSSQQNDNPLDRKWSHILQNWYHFTNFDCTPTSNRIQEIKTLEVLDKLILEAFRYHVMRNSDREYALRADVPMENQFLGPVNIGSSIHSGTGWCIEVTPEMIVQRFKAVVNWRNGPWKEGDMLDDGGDEDVIVMRKVIEEAYERWKAGQDGRNSPEEFHGEDDDETSDFMPSDEEDGEFEKIERKEWGDYEDADVDFESDEEDELEFEVVMLEEEAKIDVEPLRRALENFEFDEGRQEE